MAISRSSRLSWISFFAARLSTGQNRIRRSKRAHACGHAAIERLEDRTLLTDPGTISVIAGGGADVNPDDGDIATSLDLQLPFGVAADSAGNAFVTHFLENPVVKVLPDGTIDVLEGSNSVLTNDLASDAADHLLVGGFDGVLRVAPDGTIQQIAGGGSDSTPNDGDLATSLDLGPIAGVAAEAGGTVLFAHSDTGSPNQIIRIRLDGTIEVVAGGGSDTTPNNGDTATDLRLAIDEAATGVVAADDAGNVFFVNDPASGPDHIIKVRPDGTIEIVAGGGADTMPDDGDPAISLDLSLPQGLAVGSEGKLYAVDAGLGIVFCINPDGTIRVLSGNGTDTTPNDGDAASDLGGLTPIDLALDPLGNVFFTSNGLLIRINGNSPPEITATKDDALLLDNDGDGKADPGDVIQYTVQIDNSGGDASDVRFTDTLDPNTTLVPNSINVSPLAFDDHYLAAGELRFQGFNLVANGGGTVSITDPAQGLFANDVEFFGDTFTLTGFDSTGTAGGTLNVNIDGTFDYSPPVSILDSIDTFTYSITDDGGLTGTGNVSFDLRDTVLTINNLPITISHVDGHGAGGDGSFESPFGLLADADLDPDKANRDIVYVYSGTSLPDGPYALALGQRFLGEGDNNAHLVQTDQLGLVTLPEGNGAAAPRPVIGGNTGGVFGAAGGEVSNFKFNVVGPVLDGVNGDFNGNRLEMLNPLGGDGIEILDSTGTFTFTDVHISTAAIGILIQGFGASGDSNIIFGSDVIDPANGLFGPGSVEQQIPLIIQGHTGSFTLSPSSSIRGPRGGVSFTEANGTYMFDGLVLLSNFPTVNNGAIEILGSNGTFTFADAKIFSPTSAGVYINGGSSSVTFESGSVISVTSPDVAAVDIRGNHTGMVRFFPTSTIDATDGTGLQFTNANGVYEFGGTMTLNGGDAGIDIMGNSAGTFTFDSLTSITDAVGPGVSIQDLAAGGSVFFDGSISSTGAGDLIEVVNTAAGSTIEFRNTGSNSLFALNGGGISISGVNGEVAITTPTSIDNGLSTPFLTGITVFEGTGTVSFTDTTVLNQRLPNAAVEVLGQNGTVNFTNLDITTNDTTDGAVGFQASLSNIVNVDGTSNIDSNGAAAIELTDVAQIDLTFNNVSARNTVNPAGKRNGISLLNVRGGSLDITGVTTVRNAIGQGMFVDDAVGTFTFNAIDIDGVGDDGINLGNVIPNSGTFNFNSGSIRNVGRHGAAVGNTARVNLLNTTIDGAGGNAAVRVAADAGTSVITSTNGTFRVPGGNANAVEISTSGSAVLCLDAVGNDALGAGTGVGIDLSQSGTSILGITQSDLTEFGNDNPATATLNTTGTITFDCVVPNGAPLLTDVVTESSPGATGAANVVISDDAVATGGTGGASGTLAPAAGTLTDAALVSLIDAAIERWSETGLSESQLAILESIDFHIVDMPGWYLAAANGTSIQIDADGGGRGWFVDATPLADSEYATGGVQGFDLLTTVMHEMGHVLGLPDVYDTSASDDTMFGFLAPGQRRIPHANQADGAVADSITATVFLGSPIDIGTLPAGKSLTITFQATVNSPFPDGSTSVSNQGTISGSNFADVMTDDPDSAVESDATITEIDTAEPVFPTFTISDAVATEGGNAVFTVTLSPPEPSSSVTVSFTTQDGTGMNGATAPDDYTAQSGTLTFNPGETSLQIFISTVDDADPENTETFFVNITSATGASIGSPSSGIGTILDNDVPSETSSIHGRKWDDLNGDGTRQSNEPWLNGWTIELTDLNGNVLHSDVTMDMDIDLDGTIDPETERGWYWLTDVPAGDYILREVEQAGWRQTSPFDALAFDVWQLDQERNFRMTPNEWFNWGGLEEKWFLSNQDYHYVTPSGDLFQWDRSPRYAVSGNFVISLDTAYYNDPSMIYDAVLPLQSTITVGAGEILNDRDFGNQRIPETDGSIHGRKFDDRNSNGERDAGESWLNGWTIELRTSAGEVIATQETMDVDIDGNGTIDPETERGWYWFDDLTPGTHMLTEVVQAGWRQTAPYSDLDLLAWQLDQDLRFVKTDEFLNALGLNEKWFFSNNSDSNKNSWHYITPEGKVYSWGGEPIIPVPEFLVATFDESFYDNPMLLINAEFPQESLVRVSSGESLQNVDFGNQRLSDPGMPGEDFPGMGNVSVSLRHKNLTLIGDDASNGVIVSLNEFGRIVIRGLGDTTLNGSHDPVVTTGWVNIPRSLKAWMNGGDDAILLDGISVTQDLWLNFGEGNDRLLGHDLHVGGNYDVIDWSGDNIIAFRDAQFDGTSTVWTGSGRDVFLADTVLFRNDFEIKSGANSDLVALSDSQFEDHVRVYLESGDDNAAALGSNQFRRNLTVDGGSGYDLYEFDPLTWTARTPRVSGFEGNAIPNLDNMLDKVFQDIDNLGLDGIFDPS